MLPTQYIPHYYAEARDIRNAADEAAVKGPRRRPGLLRLLIRRTARRKRPAEEKRVQQAPSPKSLIR